MGSNLLIKGVLFLRVWPERGYVLSLKSGEKFKHICLEGHWRIQGGGAEGPDPTPENLPNYIVS